MIDFEQMAGREAISTPTEIISGVKQLAVRVNVTCDGQQFEGLYRPESGIFLTLDRRVPKPQELYRDIAYHRVDNLLGWNTSLPVIPWQMSEDDKGVLRPYLKDATAYQPYQFTKEQLLKNSGYWLRVAVLDYVCGLVDRTYNDFLITSDGTTKSIDSGLSFVEGLDFAYQKSVVRELLFGENLHPQIVSELHLLEHPSAFENLEGLIDEQSFCDMVNRSQKISDAQKVI